MGHYYISADLEGISGVTSVRQCYPQTTASPEYQQAVAQLTLELNTVIEALLQDEVDSTLVVNDAHNAMTNLHQAALHPKATLISGKPKKCAMLAGLDNRFDGVFLVGYHAKAATENGVLNHSFHGKIANITLNGLSVGEAGINIAYAHTLFSVPVVFASGDSALKAELDALGHAIPTVITKTGLSTTAAQCPPWKDLKDTYLDTIKQSLRQKADWPEWVTPLKGPYQLEIAFINTYACDLAALNPIFTRLNGTQLRYESDDLSSVYRALQASYSTQASGHYLESV